MNIFYSYKKKYNSSVNFRNKMEKGDEEKLWNQPNMFNFDVMKVDLNWCIFHFGSPFCDHTFKSMICW